MSGEHHAGKARSGDSRENHPARAELERFMFGEMGPESRAIVRHLLTGCLECRQVTGRLWSFGAAKPSPAQAPMTDTPRFQLERKPPEPRGEEAAAAAIIQAAREMLLELAAELEKISRRLAGLTAALPPRRGDSEIGDVLAEMRSATATVLQACLRSAIDDLRMAAYYPAEPPAGEGGSAP